MSAGVQTKVQAGPAQSFTPAGTGLLQRKCALCNTPGLVEDSEHDKEKLTLQSNPVDQAEPSTVPPIVHEVLRSPGQPLDIGSRALFEPRMGQDFSQVRIHTDARSNESARVLGARAYTVMPDIVFSSGQYAPTTIKGQRLLAHELTHVAQQAFDSSRSSATLEHEARRAERGIYAGFYSRLSDESPKPHLQMSPDRATRLIIVITESGDQASFTVLSDEGESLSANGRARGLSPGEYRVIFDTTRRTMNILAPDLTEIPETSCARIHMPYRSHILRLLRAVEVPIPLEVRSGEIRGGTAERGQTTEPSGATRLRQVISNLPERIRNFLFNQTSTSDIQPSDYPIILRIADKLMELSDSELMAYRTRTTTMTSDLTIFEASVDRYIAEMRQRREALLERERTKLRLYGLDEVYRQYKSYKSMLGTSATLGALGQQDPSALGTSLGIQPTLNRMQEELTANLQRYGFNSITEFEGAIQEFETAFRNETVLIARDVLDRYEHILVEQEQRYQNTAETTALHQQLQPARERFQEASRIRSEYERSQAMMWMPRMARAQVSANLERYYSPYREAMARGRSATTALSSTHPLLGRQDFPHQALAMTTPANVQTVIERYIRARRSDAQQTRQNITQNPNMIWELDNLLQQAMAEQNIRPNSIYHMIIQDHVRDRSIERALINLAIAVFAIASGLLSGGTGTVAVLGATTALGIGTYQAVEEFQRYERMSAAHGAQLLSDDPSFAWVIVAIVGAGIDLATVGAAIRALRPAIQAFNQTGDLVVLEQRLARLTQVEENIRRNVLRAAEAEAQARAAWRSAFRPPAALRMVIFPGAEEFGRLVYAVYLSVRRGIREFELFVQTREAVDLIGDIARLSPEDRTRLIGAFQQANTDLRNIVRHGQSLELTENEVHAFMRMWNNRSNITAEQVMLEMNTWHVTRQSGVPFGFRTADQFREFRSTVQGELNRLLRRRDRNAVAILQGSSITGISYARQVPFDVSSDLDVAISSQYLMRQAETRGFEVLRNPRRIGPLTDEQIRALGLQRLRGRLSRVLATEGGEAAAEGSIPARRINFMLFDNERAVRTPIGSATETTRPSLPLRINDD